MHMKNKLIYTLGATLVATSVGALAGDFSDTAKIPKSSSGGGGDWCESLQDMGKVYDNKDNSWIQEISFSGRAHQQWGYTDGSDGGRDFSNGGDELRRLRLGLDIELRAERVSQFQHWLRWLRPTAPGI
mgnify:CR=1 FL=1